MILLHRIGRRVNSNFNTIEEIMDSDGPISFDGLYTSVFDHVRFLVEKEITIFVIGKYVGATNYFDKGQPYSRFCTWPEIYEFAGRTGAKIGYHSWGHVDLTKLGNVELKIQVHPPFPMDYFAYPGGAFNSRVIEFVHNAGYKEAFSVHQGDGSQFQRKREYLKW